MRELATLSPSVEALVRIGYGLLLALQLGFTIPNARRFFSSERYGGYVESNAFTDRFHRPWVVAIAVAVWLLAALGILFDYALLPAALVNFALSRYFYVHMRWQSILRGLGAPGHINHWLGALMVFLAIAGTFDAGGILRAMTVLTFRVDFAAIMIAAGIYKLAAGYARGDGFERGLVNPWWGFFARWLRGAPAHSPAFALLNHVGYAGEILCGIAFLIPAAAPYAALFLAASFIVIGLVIRLTWLAEMVAVCCAFMITPHNPVNTIVERHLPATPSMPASAGALGAAISYALAGVLAAYLVVLPFAYGGMMWNLYAKRQLPGPMQPALDVWTRFFGLILWRVFTADIINFFTTIEIVDGATGEAREYLTPWSMRRPFRYRHVGEFICLTCLFTTLKYYPNDPNLFRRRLVRYARTIPNPHSGTVVFSYTVVEKAERTFVYRSVARYIVDPSAGTVDQQILDPAFDPRAIAFHSPIIEGATPGSYAPVAR